MRFLRFSFHTSLRHESWLMISFCSCLFMSVHVSLCPLMSPCLFMSSCLFMSLHVSSCLWGEWKRKRFNRMSSSMDSQCWGKTRCFFQIFSLSLSWCLNIFIYSYHYLLIFLYHNTFACQYLTSKEDASIGHLLALLETSSIISIYCSVLAAYHANSFNWILLPLRTHSTAG